MTRNVLIVLVVAVILLGGGAFWFNGAVSVTAVSPTRGAAVEAVYATGVVEPVTWAKVASTVPGRIKDVVVREGDKVSAGDLLVSLDDREAAAVLAEASAKERFLKSNLKRLKSLSDRDFTSRQSYDRAKSELEQSVAARKAAQRHHEEFQLRAPMDGSVLRRDGEPGEVAAVGQVLMWIGQCCPLRITAEVEEEDIPRVKTGQTALIRADAFPGQVLEGTVGEITPKGDPINKVYRVRIDLPEGSPLLIGMSTEVNVVIQEKQNVLLVPVGAVRGEAVWVLEKGRAVKRNAVIGIRGRDSVEVISGVGETDRVIANVTDGLADGARVRE